MERPEKNEPFYKVEQPDVTAAEGSMREAGRIGRRDLLSTGLASFLGLVLADSTGKGTYVRADDIPPPPATNTMCLLPTSVAVSFFNQRLLPDAAFQIFYQHFTSEGFQFFPERVQLVMFVRPAEENEDAPTLPSLLAIVPSFRQFNPHSPSHDAVSIVVMRERQVNSVLTGTVTVGHNPFQILSLGVAEIRTPTRTPPGKRTRAKDKGPLRFREVDRSTLLELDPDELAREVGLPEAAFTLDPEVGTLTTDDQVNLAAQAFQTLLTDTFARPLYPPGGVQSLLADTPLTQKWALANKSRYSGLIIPIDPRLGLTLSTSTSSSCNACTSTSTSTIEI